MKRVRFETPTKLRMDIMGEYECHSPRPFIERQSLNVSCDAIQSRPVIFSNDPLHRFENDNSSPYPTANKTYLEVIPKLENKNVPSSDLDLSMLDCSKPRNKTPLPITNTIYRTEPNTIAPNDSTKRCPLVSHKTLCSVENTIGTNPPKMLSRDNQFFLRRDNSKKLSFDSLLYAPATHPSNINEYNPIKKKSDLISMGTHILHDKENNAPPRVEFSSDCNCHHCLKVVNHNSYNTERLHRHISNINCNVRACVATSPMCSCNCNVCVVPPTCSCNNTNHAPLSPQNAVDKKTWAIEKYEKTRQCEGSEVEKSTVVLKEKREPSVSDLFKIIKLQNEQLQLLQEKVDKFISVHSHEVQDKQKVPMQNYVTEQLAVQTVNTEQHKISIGVMTSFEMVRTSTVINKEIVKQCEAQIQCNRSQISIKEVKKQMGNLNFLEGIAPVSKKTETNDDKGCPPDNFIEDKTLNELSLCNVQVDNATTPLMSPEQSLYLDIRDYSESDSGSDDQSNVGWTYYNKVMTHVNGMLQDSDMPSSASALYRHTKQKYMQLQSDKNNVSVGKRVTFGDDPLGIQRQISTPTDTSLKMNQLAAKYLKHTPVPLTPSPKVLGEMSFATKNYMERHRLWQGQNQPLANDIPKFLDITALKQQPKFI